MSIFGSKEYIHTEIDALDKNTKKRIIDFPQILRRKRAKVQKKITE